MFLIRKITVFGLQLPKRARLIASSVLASCALFLCISLPFTAAPLLAPLLFLVAYFAVWFAVLEDIHNFEWVGLFALPTLWIVVWYLFFFLVPIRGLTRVTFVIINVFFFYACCSIANIFNVWVAKSIQLHRAAFTMNILLLTVLFYLFSLTSFSFELGWASYVALFFFFGLVYALQRFWSIDPSVRLPYEHLYAGILCAVIICFFAGILSFIPFANPTSLAVATTGIAHLLVGVLTLHKQEAAFATHVREYVYSSLLLLLVILLTVQW